MSVFFHILSHNIVPLFTIIALGYLLNRKFDLNIYTLSKFSFYIFSPCFIFVYLYMTPLRFDLLKVLACGLVLLAANGILGRLIAKSRGFDIGLASAFVNSVMFNNAGNIGVSLIILIFASPPYVINGTTPYLNEAMAAQIILVVIQNVSGNTLGFFNAGRATMDAKASLRQILTMPPIYAVPAAFLLKWAPIDLTTMPVWPALTYVAGAMVPMSLLTLGVQLSKTTFDFTHVDVYLSAFSRLILGPAIGFCFIHLFDLTGIIAQTMFITSAVPTAVNTALIAVELDNQPAFAAQVVMTSTVLSTLTLSMTIYAARFLFPV